MKRHSQRLGERCMSQGQTSRYADQLRLVDADIFCEGTLKAVEVDKGMAAAENGPPGAAVFAAPTARPRSPDHGIAKRPALYLIAEHGNPPGVLMASNGTRPSHTLEHEMQIRSADPAVADLQEDIAPSDRGYRAFLDREAPRGAVDSRKHRRRKARAGA